VWLVAATANPLPEATPALAFGIDAEATVAVYLRRWLVHVQGRVRRVTYEGYEGMLRCHALPTLGGLPLSGLRPLHLQALYGRLLAPAGQGRALSAGSVLNLHLVLTQAFGQAVRWQLLPANPANGAQPPRPQRAIATVVDPAALRRLLAALAGSRLQLPAAIAAATGMRRGEILALRWADLDTSYSRAQVQRTLQPTQHGLVFEQPKTARSRRTILLPSFLTPYLTRQRRDQQHRRDAAGAAWNDHGLIIDRGDGNPCNPDSLSAAWARTLRKNKLPPIRFHDLRHAHATLMLSQGIHPKIVSERLGHASIGITLDTYSHVLPTMQEQAAAAFDSLFPETEAKPHS
jgi:integrase